MEKTKKENLKIIKKKLMTPEKFKKEYPHNNFPKACFSYDYKEYGAFETWEEALVMLSNIPDENKLFNERIMFNMKVKPFFDIEYISDEYPSLDLDELKMEIKKCILTIFKDRFDVDLDANTILFAKCHRNVPGKGLKISFHVIVNSVYVFDSAKHAKVLAILLDKMLNNNLLNSFAVGTAKGIVDLGVYKNNLNFRMVGHCKRESIGHPFVSESQSADLIDFCITNAPDDFVVLEVEELPDLLYNQIKNIKNIDLVNDPLVSEEITKKVLEYHPSATFRSIDAKGFFQFNYSDRSERCFTSEESSPRYHDKLGFFAYVTKENQIALGCHSSHCVNVNDKKCVVIVGSKDIGIKKEFKKVHLDERDFYDICPKDIKEAVNNSAYGMSELFCKMYQNPNRVKWIDEGGKDGQSYFWNGMKWECDGRGFLEHLCVKTLVYILRSYNKKVNFHNEDEVEADVTLTEEEIKNSNSIIKKLNDGAMHTSILKFTKPIINDSFFSDIKDIHPNRLSCKNGMVNLVTGELSPAVPDDNITKTLETDYDVNADSSLFENFVRDITASESGRDPEMYDYLRWLLGYAMHGNPVEKIFIILYGPHGNNGKSVLMSMIRNVLEGYSATMDKSVILEGPKKTAGAHSSEIAALVSARFATLGDTKEGEAINDGQIKQITGVTDNISFREIFGKQKEFKPVFVPFIGTNHVIKMNLTDKAMYERLVIIPFVLRFTGSPKESYERQKDPDIAEKIDKNKTGTLKWLIEAAKFYSENKKLRVPKRVQIEKEKYNMEVNVFLSFMEKCIVKTGSEYDYIEKSELLLVFKEYQKEVEGKAIGAKEAEKQFDTMLQSKKIDKNGEFTTKGRKKVYVGVVLEKDFNDDINDELM